MESTFRRSQTKASYTKSQNEWGLMSSHKKPSQKGGSKRAAPGAKGTGEYFRVVVRPKDKFTEFRTQDVGRVGGLQRLSGKRPSGSWATQAWLVQKKDAHAEGNKLIPDSEAAQELFDNLGSQPIHVEGDIYRAKDRRNIAAGDKPTQAQQKSRSQNLKKAQAANRLKNKK